MISLVKGIHRLGTLNLNNFCSTGCGAFKLGTNEVAMESTVPARQFSVNSIKSKFLFHTLLCVFYCFSLFVVF